MIAQRTTFVTGTRWRCVMKPEMKTKRLVQKKKKHKQKRREKYDKNRKYEFLTPNQVGNGTKEYVRATGLHTTSVWIKINVAHLL